MIFPSPEFDDAIAALCHDTISHQELTELHKLLHVDSAAQDEYLWRVEVHSQLASSNLNAGHASQQNPDLHPRHTLSISTDVRPQIKPSQLRTYVLIAALLLATVFLPTIQSWLQAPASPAIVAQFTVLQDVRWMAPEIKTETGDLIQNKQRIELSSGSVTVQFDSGAILQLVGPAILEPRSKNSASLLLGEARLLAETPTSKGFELLTPNSKFVDISTAFTAVVAPDGLSRLEVIEGEVDVVLDRSQTPSSRMRTGETLYVEPGERQVMTRIEPGDGTAAFNFPNIAPPSHEDYADHQFGRATVRVTQGELRNRPGPAASGPASVLIDGVGQSKQDAPLESAFFESPGHGSFLMDLGQAIDITRINSYSWHQHERIKTHRHRAQQRFTLYGYAGDEPPDLSQPPQDSGWTRITRVNTDQFFRVTEAFDRPLQQACSITAGHGTIGRFRYLLWEVKSQSFFSEFDVFGVQP